jgi:hypothetical protein
LRKAGATIAAENGATDRQLMAMLDWTTLSQASGYVRAADKKRLAGDAARWRMKRDQTSSPRLRPKLQSIPPLSLATPAT